MPTHRGCSRRWNACCTARKAAAACCCIAEAPEPRAHSGFARKRTALGFDVQDIAVIRPCVDVFDPKTVRASMGSIFQLRLHVYDDFSQYQAQFPEHALYPFMLDGSKSLPDVLGDIPDRWTLIFGNEVDSLNLSIAAAIGIYAFARR